MNTPRRALRQMHLHNIQEVSTPLKIPSSPFMKSLGFGTGVNVFRLERSPKYGEIRSPWAVKRISQKARTNGDEIYKNRIQKEADILRKLSHPNIVGFRGVGKTETDVDSLVLECCNTCLGIILEKRNEDNLGPLPAVNILKMMLDISNALNYLHTEAKMLHGDLKSFNILIKGNFKICKLCDFGVSLPLDDNGNVDFGRNPQLRYIGTELWSAPEVLDEENVIDCKADIFSFGLVIYETIALIPPHTIAVNDDLENTFNSNDNSQNTDEISSACLDGGSLFPLCGTRPPLPQQFELKDEYNKIIELFYCCTDELAENRPMAKVICDILSMEQQPETEDDKNGDEQTN